MTSEPLEASVKWLVPVMVVAYGDDPEEAIQYVEKALDNTWFVGEDGVYSAEVIGEEVESYEND